jgi:hypothetical protein
MFFDVSAFIFVHLRLTVFLGQKIKDKVKEPAMKRSSVIKSLFCAAAGIAAVLAAREIPAMIRYYKMTRL